jgi:hypothetical protein
MFEQKRVDLVFVLIVGSAVVLFVCGLICAGMVYHHVIERPNF